MRSCWSPTPLPAVTDTVYAPGVRYAKNAQPSVVVDCDCDEVPEIETCTLSWGKPLASRTFAAIDPVAAEYAPAGGARVVTDSTGAVPPAPAHVTDSVTCRIPLLPTPPLSHALV